MDFLRAMGTVKLQLARECHHSNAFLINSLGRFLCDNWKLIGKNQRFPLIKREKGIVVVK